MARGVRLEFSPRSRTTGQLPQRRPRPSIISSIKTMNTLKVETFEVEETSSDAATMAADSEASELIQSLGLRGQQALLNPETVERCAYRLITKEEEFVYRSDRKS